MIRLLFEIGHLYHRAAIDPLYHEFRRDPRYDIAFICSNDAERRFGLFNRSLRRGLEARFRAEGLKIADDTHGFDVVITGDTVRDPKRYDPALLCFVNHGTGIKNILYRNLRKQLNTPYQIFVEGDYRADKIRQEGVLGASTLHKVGLPKLDPLFGPRKPSRGEILSRLGLDPALPTVLFAPTYKPTCIDVVRERILTETRGYNLVIKLHQYSWRGKYAPHWHHRLYQRAVKAFPNAVLLSVDEYNIVPYLYAADTLISEASSTVFDFLALDKTGIIFVLPETGMRHHDGEPLLGETMQDFLQGAFMHIRHPDEIGDAVAAALQENSERRQRAQAYRKYFFYGLDGRASQRTKSVIERLLDEGGRADLS